MRYWVLRATGALVSEAAADAVLTDGRFDLTPDIELLPGPLACCVWDGQTVSVDAQALARLKARLSDRLDELAVARVALTVTTPQGTFRIRRDDIERYIGIGFAALFARLNNTALNVTVRDVNGAAVPLTRDQLLGLLAAIGQRYYTVFQQTESSRAALAVATAEQLRDFDPEAGIG